ncbi:MAG: S1 RNA-binding domain-containing protein, partial [Gordonia sp. (in: high G+C Gram-positive bacteria)]|uniref:S1 RNA-binding domain-containing protein n=1 Tax=Gordonia sp. (in: high G+C Gram-positive bacteria) TaxID=84139 RepID=UPI003BB4DD76
PRPAFATATFASGVEKVSDLKPGMVLEGVVTNVAAFGAFVDVGVHQDGLVHVSAMSEKFISDPHEVVRSGQVVKVKVLDVDVDRQRIGLTLRLNDEPGGGKSTRVGQGGERTSGGNAQRSSQQRGSQQPRGGGKKRREERPATGSMADALRNAGFGR